MDQKISELTKLTNTMVKGLTLKVGGDFWGSIDGMGMNYLRKLLTLFVKTGMPEGLVYSAPKGVTRQLETFLGLSRLSLEQFMQANRQVDALFKQYDQALGKILDWINSCEPDLQRHSMFEQIVDQARRSSEKLREVTKSVLLEYRQLEEVSAPEASRLVARVLAVGEKALGEIVLEPAFGIVFLLRSENFPRVHFLRPDEDLVVAPKNHDPLVFTNVIPDMIRSAANIRQARNRAIQFSDGDVSSFMSGFYMDKKGDMAIMPFNGSDISARLVQRAIGGQLMFVKRVEGQVPPVADLISAQKAQTVNDGKPRELISTFVLESLLERGDVSSVSIYDMTTESVIQLVP